MPTYISADALPWDIRVSSDDLGHGVERMQTVPDSVIRAGDIAVIIRWDQIPLLQFSLTDPNSDRPAEAQRPVLSSELQESGEATVIPLRPPGKKPDSG